MDISFFSRFLPPEMQQALPQIKSILNEKEIVSDLSIALTELEKALAAADKNPALDKKLKDAFNDAASITSISKTYLQQGGKLSIFTAAKAGSNYSSFKNSGKVLSEAFKTGHPAALAFAQSMKANDTFYNAIKRLVVNTNERLFRLEAGKDGCGYAVELLTGKSMKVPLKKEDYEEIRKALAAGKKPPAAKPPRCA